MAAAPNIEIYGMGLVACSVCAPADMTREEVTERVNAQSPTGLESRWAISDEPHFASGQPNPCRCDTDAGRKHWLMAC